MRVALVAPLHERIPPDKYGGTERVVAYLAEGLTALGNSVTVFAARGSLTAGELVECWPATMREIGPGFGNEEVPYTAQLRLVLERAASFDVVHIHHGTFPFQRNVLTHPGPFVWTDHYLPELDGKPEIWSALTRDVGAGFIAISDCQRRTVPHANWLGTVHHGLPSELLVPIPGTEPSYLAFLGRFAPEKGIMDAVRIATAANIKLKVAAKIEPVYQLFYEEEILPSFKENSVEFLGEIAEVEKSPFLSGAIALLVPSLWEEPFGLVFIEAMACGTPVIAYNRGAVSEIIDDGVTGYIVDSFSEAVACMHKVHTLDRHHIRKTFEEKFSAKVMASKHVEIYEQMTRSRESISMT